MDTKKGFTLIELLVVISIIALLMAVLIPALRAAKAAATGSVCVSNLHSLAMAWFTYSIENNDKIVNGNVSSSNFARRTYWVTPPMDISGNYIGNSPLCDIEDKKRGIRDGTLFPYTKDVEVYHCPADKRYRRAPGHPTANNADGGYRSYSIPDGANGDPKNTYNIARYSQINKPAEKYVFIEENDSRGWNKGSWVLEDYDTLTKFDWTDQVASWHNEKSTLGWADGHANVHRWVDKRTIEMAQEEDRDIVKQIRDRQTDNDDIIFMKRHFPALDN